MGLRRVAARHALRARARPTRPGPQRRAARKRRQPPPAVIPTAETQQADQLLRAGRYDQAVVAGQGRAQQERALHAGHAGHGQGLLQARHKYEWTKKLWEMMQANGASDAEKSEIYQLLAFLEVDQKNVPGAIALFKKAAEARPDNADPLEQPGRPVPDGQELHARRRPCSRRRPSCSRGSPRRT